VGLVLSISCLASFLFVSGSLISFVLLFYFFVSLLLLFLFLFFLNSAFFFVITSVIVWRVCDQQCLKAALILERFNENIFAGDLLSKSIALITIIMYCSGRAKQSH